MSKFAVAVIPALILAGWVLPTFAQEAGPGALGEPHEALSRHAGVWQAEATFRSWADPTGPVVRGSATVAADMIMGGRFLFQDIRGEVMGRPLHAIGILGFDTVAGEYQVTSFDNTGTGMTRYTGALTETGDIVLHNTYTDRATGEVVARRTVRRLISEDEWLETAHEVRRGVERLVMEIRAQRVR